MISVNPVATHASKYYNVTGDELDLIALVSWIINIPGLWFGLMNSLHFVWIIFNSSLSRSQKEAAVLFRDLHNWTVQVAQGSPASYNFVICWMSDQSFE